MLTCQNTLMIVRHMRACVVFFFAAFGLPAVPALGDGSDEPFYIDVACNAHGAVLTLGSESVAPGRVYYLGKDCDAVQPNVGTGRWYYAAGAFIVDVSGQSLRFERDLDCPSLPYCRP